MSLIIFLGSDIEMNSIQKVLYYISWMCTVK